ncbi:hypothetical protein [Clostridium sp.]|uniref:hypothetical protein n=1 Tax=Clostridium sp. TaxID=1506 RepID=UPI00283FCF89|nr:hypothetical protein [Clostridium sp.]MDR3595829.1 hypothetical protein [Clostridium sp.]
MKTKQLNGLVEKLAIADDLTDILMDKIRQIKKEIQTLESELNSANESIQNDSSELFDSKFISAVLDKCINIKNESLENQRRIINYLVDKIVYNNDDETLHIYPLGSSEDKKKQVFKLS